MNYAEKINRLYELKSERNKISKRLESIDRDIEQEQEECKHIGINLGYKNWMSNCLELNQCLICGKIGTFFDPKFLIHAEEYIKQLDPMVREEYEEKFDTIQILALGIIKDNPTMKREEIVKKLNDFIQENIVKRKEKQGSQFTKKKS